MSYINKNIKKLVIMAMFLLCLSGCRFNDNETSSKIKENDVTSKGEGYVYRLPGYAENICTGKPLIKEEDLSFAKNINGACLMDLSDKEIVYGSNLYKEVAPASTTKIMTALITLENLSMDEEITVSKKAASYGKIYTLANLLPGDEVTVRNLLYGLMLPSGNDAATVLAEHIGGSTEKFAQIMTQRAIELGAKNTQFKNANGIDADGHYSCPYDLYLIFQEALKYPEFMDIIHTKEYEAPIRSVYGYVRKEKYVQTNHYLTGKAKSPSNINVWGGKTGTTSAAGKCLVLYSLNEKHKPFISVILGAKDGKELYENMNELLECANK